MLVAEGQGPDAYVDFINHVQAYAASKGRKLRIWNDGLAGANTVPVPPGRAGARPALVGSGDGGPGCRRIGEFGLYRSRV